MQLKMYKGVTVLPVEESHHLPFLRLQSVLFHDVWVRDQLPDLQENNIHKNM